MNKRRTKQNSEYWERRIKKLLDENHDAHLVKNRYRSLRWFLIDKYAEIINVVGKDAMCDFLKDVTFLDRELRRHTEGEDQETKDELEEEKLTELGYYE